MIKEFSAAQTGICPFIMEFYNSARAVVADSTERKITDWKFDDKQKVGEIEKRKDWHGVESWAQAIDFLENGYQPIVEKLKTQIKASVQGNGHRYLFANDVVGYAPIVPLALQNVPNSMVNSRMKQIKAKVIDVYYNPTVEWTIKSDKIITAGAKLLGTILKLEQQGYRFNVYCIQMFGEHKNNHYSMCVKIKSAEQPIDLKRMSFPLTHTAFLRAIGFDWFSRFPQGKYIYGYGRPIDADFETSKIEKAFKQMFGDNAMYISAKKIIDDGEKYIEKVLGGKQ